MLSALTQSVKRASSGFLDSTSKRFKKLAADVVLPVVGCLRIFGRVLDADRGVSVHVDHGFQLEVANVHHGWVVQTQRLVDAQLLRSGRCFRGSP